MGWLLLYRHDASLWMTIGLNPMGGGWRHDRQYELMEWMPPSAGVGMMLHRAMVALTEGRQMTQVHILAINLAKRSFQVCGTDRGGAALFNRHLSRARLQQLLNEQSPCIVAMEACVLIMGWPALLRHRV